MACSRVEGVVKLRWVEGEEKGEVINGHFGEQFDYLPQVVGLEIDWCCWWQYQQS